MPSKRHEKSPADSYGYLSNTHAMKAATMKAVPIFSEGITLSIRRLHFKFSHNFATLVQMPQSFKMAKFRRPILLTA